MRQSSDRRPEPEIIPPGEPLPRGAAVWMTNDTHRTHYVYTSRIGPIGLALLTLAAGGIAALAILFLLSAAVIGFAAIGVVTVAAIIAGILRRPNHPLR
jgi:hypothetical protein